LEADIFQIPLAIVGSVSISARPRGGDWLDDEIAMLSRLGVGLVVSLLCDDEQIEFGLEDEAASCARHQIEFVSLPVPDRGVQSDTATFIGCVNRLACLVRNGTSVTMHCRQSVGRAGLLAVSILVALGMSLDNAINIVSHTRGVTVPETKTQLDWLIENQGTLFMLLANKPLQPTSGLKGRS
jgi:hypothetical protein